MFIDRHTLFLLFASVALASHISGCEEPPTSDADELDCRLDAICGTAETCNEETGICEERDCRADNYCTADEMCDEQYGICLPLPCPGGCDSGLVCESGECVACDEQDLRPSRESASAMLVLDRSRSMRWSVPGTELSRWEITRRALIDMIESSPDTEFGLTVFPEIESHNLSSAPSSFDEEEIQVNVPISDSGREQILAILEEAATEDSEYYPGNIARTPMYTAVRLGLEATPESGHLVLVSDGKKQYESHSTCRANVNISKDSVEAQVELHRSSLGITTHDVAFGNGLDASATNCLRDVALAGGTTSYRQADTEEDLAGELNSVMSFFFSCSHTLNNSLPHYDEDLLQVVVDGIIQTQAAGTFTLLQADGMPRRGDADITGVEFAPTLCRAINRDRLEVQVLRMCPGVD